MDMQIAADRNVTQTDAEKKEGKRFTTKLEQEIMIITSNN
jgi:hypothetical protein